MSRVFLMGPLTWPPLMQAVMGDVPPPQDVSLNNVAFGAPSAFGFPHIEAGASSAALALDLTDAEAFDRLCYLAGAVGAHPVPKHGRIDGVKTSGILFVADGPPQGPPLDLEAWAPVWGEVACRAAAEILDYRDRLPCHALTWRMPTILARAVAQIAAQDTPRPTCRSDTRIDTVEVHEVRACHEGFFLTRAFDLQHPQFDGKMSARLRREVFVATDAVIVLPYDPIRDRVLLVEQFRMGPFGRGDPYPWVLEPVAGRVDAGESLENAARRECEEEAGLTLDLIEHVSSHYFSPGASTEYYHCFVALADLPHEVAGLGGVETEHEDIRTHVLDFDHAMQLVESGEANIGPMILLLLWLQRERPRLRSGAHPGAHSGA